MRFVTVALGLTRLAPEDHRLRPIDESRANEIAASYKHGSEQIHEYLSYEAHGIFYIIGGSHAYVSCRNTHEDPFSVRLAVIDAKEEKDVILFLLRADNHKELDIPTWQKHLRRLRPFYSTQRALAEAVGLKESTVSEYINGDPKARLRESYAARKAAETSIIEVPKEYISTEASIPQDLGGTGTGTAGVLGIPPTPTLPPNGGDDGARVIPSGIGSLGETGRSPQGERGSGSVVLRPELAVPKASSIQPILAPQPPLSSHLDALERDVEPVLKRSVWTRAQDARWQRVRLETLYWRLGDLLMSLEDGHWNGEAPVARPKKPLPTFKEGDTVSVETHGKSLILKVLDDGRFRIKDTRGDVQVVSGRMILAAERARA